MPQSMLWTDKGDRLERTLTFATFGQAMGFMVEIALYCDKADHHPDWRNVYNRVEVTLTTHDAGGVTDKDRALAAHIDVVYGRYAR